VDEAIYNERILARMLGMRRTMFVVPADLVPIVQAACTDDVAKRLRRQLEKDLGVGGVGDGDPTVWWAGRVVGGWAQRPSGEIVCRLLEDLGADGADAVSREADRLEAWLGANRVTPRFRTPLERELSA
jgi:hypothetical protein